MKDFFRKYYGPTNASARDRGRRRREGGARAGREVVRRRARSAIPCEPDGAAPGGAHGEKRITLEDKVQLPRLYLAWLTPPAFAPGDAALDAVSALLATGKNSRLYKRLVYELQVAQDVSAFQDSRGSRLDVQRRS